MSAESLAVIVVALAVGSFAKGMTGLGLPPVAIAILMTFFGAEHAIVVATIPVAFSNLQIVWVWRRRLAEVPRLRGPAAAAAAGVAAGTWILVEIDGRTLAVVLAAWIAVFLAAVLFDLKIRPTGRGARLFAPAIAAAAGICQGATGISGPLVATWGYAWGFVKETYVLATSVLFMAISLMHVAAVAAAGLYDGERLAQGLLAVAPVAVFVPLGMRMARRLSPRVFRMVVVAAVGAMEARLVWELATGG